MSIMSIKSKLKQVKTSKQVKSLKPAQKQVKSLKPAQKQVTSSKPVQKQVKSLKPASKQVKILIVDDHQMVRDGIRLMLESQEKPYNFLVEEAEDGEIGIEMARQSNYDFIIMDYQMPKVNGVDATKAIVRSKPGSKILAVSNYDEYMQITNMLDAGVKGFVLKNISPEELVKAIDTILNGQNYYSNDVAVKLIGYQNDIFPKSPLGKIRQYNLSKREVEILKLIAKGMPSDAIAGTLYISRRTVDSHRQSLLNKLNISNSIGLIKFAIDSQIL